MVLNMIINPYTPGAGMTPKYIAGREELVEKAKETLAYIANGYAARSVVYYGLRGVGKTVLLNAIMEIAEENDMYCEHIEVSERKSFRSEISLYVNKILRNMSTKEVAKHYVQKAMKIAKAFRVRYDPNDGVSVEVDAELRDVYGISDTGNLTNDMTELFVHLGRVGKKINKGAVFFIDEAQYMKEEELEALMAALHRCNQLGLPIALFCAGLPKITKTLGDVKSYAERLFEFFCIDKLSVDSAKLALTKPAQELGVEIREDALSEILKRTDCYPYFLQEYGKQVWQFVREDDKVLTYEDAVGARDSFIRSLDEGFFRVRVDRASTGELEFMKAMVLCDSLPCQTSQVAVNLNKSASQVSTTRAQLIHKGLIYAVDWGTIDFTVPHFDRYLKRTYQGL